MHNLTDQYLLYRTVYFQDPDAFAQLHQRYFEKVYAFVIMRVSSKEDAEDIASQAFLQAWEFLTRKSSEKLGHFRGFIYKIARNEVIDHWRKKGRTPALVSVDAPEEDMEVADWRQDQFLNQLKAADQAAVREGLTRIKEEYQEALILRFLEEMSIKEIAEIIGKTPGNVRVLIHRGVKALGNVLRNPKV